MIHQEGTLCYDLKTQTATTHDSVDNLVMSVKPFENNENYTRFLQLQSVFHKIVDPIYHDVELNQKIDQLASLARFADVKDDLADLGAQEPQISLEIPQTEGNAAIGWLYCAEGSNLGAAFLFKEAKKINFDENHGARHLAGHPDGRGKHWRRFAEQLNQLPLNEAERQEVIEGALTAFAFYKVLLHEIYQLN